MQKVESLRFELAVELEDCKVKHSASITKANNDPVHFSEWNVPDFCLNGRKIKFLDEFVHTLDRVISGDLVVDEEMVVQSISQSISYCLRSQCLSTSTVREVETQVSIAYHKYVAFINWRLSKALEMDSPTLKALRNILH